MQHLNENTAQDLIALFQNLSYHFYFLSPQVCKSVYFMQFSFQL